MATMPQDESPRKPQRVPQTIRPSSPPPFTIRDYWDIYWNAWHVSGWYVFQSGRQRRPNIDTIAVRCYV